MRGSWPWPCSGSHAGGKSTEHARPLSWRLAGIGWRAPNASGVSFGGSWRRTLSAVAALAAGVALAAPAGAAAAGRSATGWTIHGSRNGSTVVSIGVGGSWDLRMLRPRTGLVVVELLPLNRTDYSYSEMAFPSGEADAFWIDGNSGGFASSVFMGPPPRWVNAGPAKLAAGRYLVTLLTTHPTQVILAPSDGASRLRSMRATGKTTASVASRTLTKPSTQDTARQTVDFQVPAHAHQVILLGTARWNGSRKIDYDDLCYGARAAPCTGDPEFAATRAVNPGSTNASWTESEMSLERPSTTGASTASFYFVVSGTMTSRTVTAIGLP